MSYGGGGGGGGNVKFAHKMARKTLSLNFPIIILHGVSVFNQCLVHFTLHKKWVIRRLYISSR